MSSTQCSTTQAPVTTALRRYVDHVKPPAISATRSSRHGVPRFAFVLVGVALGTLCLLAWLLRPTTTVPTQVLESRRGEHHGHMGRTEVSAIVVTPVQPPPFRALVKGRDYFSDFDVSRVAFDPEPVATPARPLLFHYVDPAKSSFAIKYVSNTPRVAVVQDFLSAEECDALIREASKTLFRSQVAPTINSKDAAVQDVRTSSQAWLHAGSEPARHIVERIIALTGFPAGSNEELQILRYQVGQKYDAHNDYFDPKMYGPQATNRALTFYLYLSDVEEGGETWFPRADGKPPTFDYTSCSRGIGVRPKKGMAVLFYDMKPNGELDPYSLHGACPVKKGVKWGGTLWLRMPTK